MPTPFLLNGILASQISGHLYAGPAGAFDALGSVTLATSQSSIVFNAIPQTYTHLQIRAFGECASGDGNINLYINGETSANDSKYYRHFLYGNGSSAVAGSGTGSGMVPSYWPDTTHFGVFVQDILDYSNTHKNKTSRALGGQDGNGSGYVLLYSAQWMDTTAISTLTYSANGGSFAAGTTFALYGIK